MEKNNEKPFLIRYVPTGLSLLAVLLAMTGALVAVSGKFELACTLILLACFLDGIDGRIARWLGVSSDFGAQIDSLADAINFGVAPGLVVYFWKLNELNSDTIGWSASVLLIFCMVIRLARFNVDLSAKDQNDPLIKYFFRGMPAPAVAGMVILPLVLSFQFGEGFWTEPWIVWGNTILMALFAGSVIPTPCMKKLHFTGVLNVLYKALLYFIFFAIIVKPWLGLSIFGAVYLVSIAIAIFMYLKIKGEKANKKA
jgi:CDP-diacylglycerol--serine O-phosphatidyltransferase